MIPVRFVLPVLLTALLGLSACSEASDSEAVADRVSHEMVERFKTLVLLDLQQIDRDIAALETRVAAADSVQAVSLGQTAEALRADRQALQRRIDALDVGPRAAFDEATATIERGVAVLQRRLAPAIPSDSTVTTPDPTASSG